MRILTAAAQVRRRLRGWPCRSGVVGSGRAGWLERLGGALTGSDEAAGLVLGKKPCFHANTALRAALKLFSCK